MPDPIPLPVKPRRYTVHVEHHPNGTIKVVIDGIPDGSITRATLRDILLAILKELERERD